MTETEAIEFLKAHKKCAELQASGIAHECNMNLCDDCELLYAQGTVGEHREAVGVAIKALEKAIPKKPDYEGDGYVQGELFYDTWICPCCETKYEVDYDDYDYCPKCGQAIDWGE